MSGFRAVAVTSVVRSRGGLYVLVAGPVEQPRLVVNERRGEGGEGGGGGGV